MEVSTEVQAFIPTPAQRRILTELAKDGPPNPELAQRLDMNIRTLKWHLGEVMGETGCKTRTALVLWWIRQGQYATEVEDG